MLKRLKRAIKEINKKQNGQVLILVLIVLALGGIVLAPTLNYTASSLKHQQVLETDTLELYSADSGVASALVALSDGDEIVAPYVLNGKDVTVSIIGPDTEGNYLITSTATTPDGGSTTIHTGVSSDADFSYLLDSALTSNGDMIIKGDIIGDVLVNGDVDVKGDVDGNLTAAGEIINPENVSGNVTLGIIESWPSASVFSTYYSTNFDKSSPYAFDFINLDGVSTSIGPLYVDGDLDIYNSSNTGANLTLEDTLYITGDTLIGGSHAFTLNLNGNTIFIESDSADPQKALNVGGQCTIIGSGCIIVVGDIYFAPGGDVGDEENFVFIMSVSGTTWLQPVGDFYGSVAGSTNIILQPGCYLEWNPLGSEGGLNFPYDEVGVLGGSTTSMVLGGWDIS